MSKVIDMVGKRVGKLSVIKKAYSKHRNMQWLCSCDCGAMAIYAGCDLRSGKIKSCGCLRREGKTLHGITKTPFHHVWQDMKQRCNNHNVVCYANYGGRGITVCDRWLVFTNFKDDMYESYIKHKENNSTTTIERVDNDGDYCPENCCWATQEEQLMNKRVNCRTKLFRAISPQNEIFEDINQCDFARKHNLKPKKINDVLRGRRNSHSGWAFSYV